MADPAEYLKRSLDHMIEVAIEEAGRDLDDLLRKASAAGRGGSPYFFESVMEAFRGIFERTLANMLERVSQVAEPRNEDAIDLVDGGAKRLQDALSDLLVTEIRRTKLERPDTEPFGSDFERLTTRAMERAVDDYWHGIVGGKKVDNDALRAVINVIDSPQTTIQTGTGNSQTVSHSNSVAAVKASMRDLLEAPEVLALKPLQKAQLAEFAALLADELNDAPPKPSTIRRLGKKLADVGEQLGVGVLSNGVFQVILQNFPH